MRSVTTPLVVVLVLVETTDLIIALVLGTSAAASLLLGQSGGSARPGASRSA